MISCRDFITEIGSYLDGDAAAEVRLQLENHLAHCQTCQVVYDTSRKTCQIITDSGSFDLPETASKSITQKIMARIRGGMATDP